jgi:hypothetical protein
MALTQGCKEGAKHDDLQAEESQTEQEKKGSELVPATLDLKQNGNYTSLFNSPDCKVITAEEISTTLGVRFTDMQIKNLCSFKAELPNNKTWYLSILRNDMGKSDIQREIESFKSDETGMLVLEISETGDTYLCNQHMQGYLSIYNTNYDGSMSITYGSVGESRGFTKEERLEHRDLAVQLANALLKKHQK